MAARPSICQQQPLRFSLFFSFFFSSSLPSPSLFFPFPPLPPFSFLPSLSLLPSPLPPLFSPSSLPSPSPFPLFLL
ncbi:hypothetical protein ACXWRW_11235, partial [Streptococcus pyogenes]